jgi:dihydroxyacetone kinase
MFTVAEDSMELGLGVHGEPGVRTIPRLDAHSLAGVILDELLADAPKERGRKSGGLGQRSGSTSCEELFVLYGAAAKLLEAAELKVENCEIGELVTSLDMTGCSLSLFWQDDEPADLYVTPAAAAGYRSGPR